MNVVKSQAAAAPVRHDQTQQTNKPKVNAAQENQRKQAQVQNVQENKKPVEPAAPEARQKGGEINITV